MARAVIATVLTAWAFSVPVHAQQEIRLIAPEPNEGFSRIQGRENTAPPPPPPPSEEILMDMREEMRKFVISIAQFGRQYRSDFRIIARGGLDLLVKRDDVDEEKDLTSTNIFACLGRRDRRGYVLHGTTAG